MQKLRITKELFDEVNDEQYVSRKVVFQDDEITIYYKSIKLKGESKIISSLNFIYGDFETNKDDDTWQVSDHHLIEYFREYEDEYNAHLTDEKLAEIVHRFRIAKLILLERMNEKLSELEKELIDDSLKFGVANAKKEIEGHIKDGKRPIFAPEFFDSVSRNIKLKLNIK